MDAQNAIIEVPKTTPEVGVAGTEKFEELPLRNFGHKDMVESNN
jgi:hypothetical protein